MERVCSAAEARANFSELVTEEAGRVVPYGGDSWKLEKPDFSNLAASASPRPSG